MTISTRHPAQQGFAWRGDWQQRLKELLLARGFASVEAYAATSPTKSFIELAEDLGPGDVAAVQLEWTYLDDAKRAGTVERCARDLLVRQLHAKLPDGWTTARDSDAAVMPRVRATSAWSSSISSHLPEYKPLVRAIGDTMIRDDPFPIGWLPSSADDPILVEFFKHHWVEP
jgi:hypothetical protein